MRGCILIAAARSQVRLDSHVGAAVSVSHAKEQTMTRSMLVFVMLSVVAGCSTGNLTDSTANRSTPTLAYPAGPFGYTQGSTIQNIEYIGKVPTAGTEDFSQLMMSKVSLGD